MHEGFGIAAVREAQTGHGDLAGGRTAEECGARGGRRDAGGAKKPATPVAPHASRQAAQAAPTFECIPYLSRSLIPCFVTNHEKRHLQRAVRLRAAGVREVEAGELMSAVTQQRVRFVCELPVV